MSPGAVHRTRGQRGTGKRMSPISVCWSYARLFSGPVCALFFLGPQNLRFPRSLAWRLSLRFCQQEGPVGCGEARRKGLGSCFQCLPASFQQQRTAGVSGISGSFPPLVQSFFLGPRAGAEQRPHRLSSGQRCPGTAGSAMQGQHSLLTTSRRPSCSSALPPSLRTSSTGHGAPA